MKTLILALALLIPQPVGQQQVPAPTGSSTAHQEASTTGGVAVKDKPAEPKHGSAVASDHQHDLAGTAQPPPPSPPRPRWTKHPWLRFMSLGDTDKISIALLLVTTFYLLTTVGILFAMRRSNAHAEDAYAKSKSDTTEGLRIASDGQIATARAVKVAENQLSAILNVARPRLAVESLMHLPIVELSHANIIYVSIINRGHTPAVDVKVLGISATTKRGEPIDWDVVYAEAKDDAEGFGNFESVGIIGAGLPCTLPIEVFACSAEEIAAFRDYSLELHLHGKVQYSDVFQPLGHALEFTAYYSTAHERWVVGKQTET